MQGKGVLGWDRRQTEDTIKHYKNGMHVVRTRFDLRVDGMRWKFGSIVASAFERSPAMSRMENGEML